jgi:hypothetical protein
MNRQKPWNGLDDGEHAIEDLVDYITESVTPFGERALDRRFDGFPKKSFQN